MGAAVGFISGLFGIGGGFLMTPLLIFLGIPPAIAVGTQQAQIAASSMTSTLAAWRRDAIDLKLSGFLLGGGFVGTMLGVWFFSVMRRAGQLELVIVVSYVTLFGVIGGLMLKESVREFLAQRPRIPRRGRGPRHRGPGGGGRRPPGLSRPAAADALPEIEALHERHPDRRAVALRRLCRRGARHRRRLHRGAGAALPLPRAADRRGRDVAVPDPVDDARRDRPPYRRERRRRRGAGPDADPRRCLR